MKLAHTLFTFLLGTASLVMIGCSGSGGSGSSNTGGLDPSTFLPPGTVPSERYGTFEFSVAAFGWDQEFLNQNSGALIEVHPTIQNTNAGGDFIPYGLDQQPDPLGTTGIPHAVNTETDERAARDQNGIYFFYGFTNPNPGNPSFPPGDGIGQGENISPPGTGGDDIPVGNKGFWLNKIAYSPGSSSATLEADYTLSGLYQVEFQAGNWGSHWVIMGAPYTIRRVYQLTYQGINEAGQYYGTYTCKMTYTRSWRHNSNTGQNASGETVPTTVSGNFTFTPGT